MKRTIFFLLFLSTCGFGQIVTIGPLNPPAMNPSSCVVVPNQTSVCFASDGVHVSIAGLPYGGAVCDSTNPSCLGPQGLSGETGAQGIQGLSGPPGVIQGQTVTGSGSMTCQPAKGSTVASGFTCTFTNLTFKVISIQ